jgi:hypothetical protein
MALAPITLAVFMALPAPLDEGPDVDALLAAGAVQDAAAILEAHLEEHPEDAERRFGLGFVRLFGAVERVGQRLHRHGFDPKPARALSYVLPAITELPIPVNEAPEVISYDDWRSLLLDWRADLASVEQALAPLEGRDVGLLLRPQRIRLDLDGDGVPDLPLLDGVLVSGALTDLEGADSPQPIAIRFDAADVSWLRGYVALVSALTEVFLAHDARELFERTAQLVFPKVDSPYPFLSDWRDGPEGDWSWLRDFVALIGLLDLEVTEPERMGQALVLLRTSAAHSLALWDSVLSETDDDHEWIPSPTQWGPLGVTLSHGQVSSWQEMLREADRILAGERLVPFWRRGTGQGLNVARVFTEPRRFSLMSWIQGPAAVPYLEEGTLTEPDTWREVRRAFGPDLFTRSIWLN